MKAVYENHYLADQDVANYARHSFADLAANFTVEQNDNLIRFLARGVKTGDWNKLLDQMVATETREEAEALAVYLRKIPCHWVPFGHPHISLRMKAPVPIRTQCFKHKIGYVESEESRRYIKSEPEFFVPDHFRAVAEDVKQGSAPGPHPRSDYWLQTYNLLAQRSIQCYLDMINDGVCPEQARFALIQGVEVNWVWTGSLYAFAMAYNARSDSHAQQEVQDLFMEVDKIITPLYPVSWAALTGE
jgi:thymidylate synthase (FAD)